MILAAIAAKTESFATGFLFRKEFAIRTKDSGEIPVVGSGLRSGRSRGLGFGRGGSMRL